MTTPIWILTVYFVGAILTYLLLEIGIHYMKKNDIKDEIPSEVQKFSFSLMWPLVVFIGILSMLFVRK